MLGVVGPVRWGWEWGAGSLECTMRIDLALIKSMRQILWLVGLTIKNLCLVKFSSFSYKILPSATKFSSSINNGWRVRMDWSVWYDRGYKKFQALGPPALGVGVGWPPIILPLVVMCDLAKFGGSAATWPGWHRRPKISPFYGLLPMGVGAQNIIISKLS